MHRYSKHSAAFVVNKVSLYSWKYNCCTISATYNLPLADVLVASINASTKCKCVFSFILNTFHSTVDILYYYVVWFVEHGVCDDNSTTRDNYWDIIRQ